MSEDPSGGERVAFFGGSFDPPHLGHIAVANAARQSLQLDRVLFAPVGLQPLKPTGPSASFDDRVAMTRIAIANHPGFELSLFDAPNLAKSKPNYTIDTLQRLRESETPDLHLYFLLGADSFFTLRHWHRAAEIPFLADLVVASRPAADSTQELDNVARYLPAEIALHALPGQPNQYRLTNHAGQHSELTILPGLNYDISATQLRGQIQDNADQPKLLDPAVLQYIQRRHLYQ
jgi:nicotinate-nucleotide adenylyltransferase